ncbi:DUF342 domain-containing protein [Desulforamulus aeronauticus]|uniref:Flagellar Assembly Protein A N-terminal region domain-containing protein n=1 Tax=Desulforamulus aeronauticus DSM 10349 TaxID=1121421 RepID=A0A1M6UN78_9FIRM|nr:FapA family protein [Desulforamulus aeronauticus]SHK70654.1 hypothetical protein SAMN02745123_02835 [Desulforamulus aeronauticus DSM 10349]
MENTSGDKNLTSPNLQASVPNSSPTERKGLAWVKDGKIFVQNPIGDAPKATFTPSPEVQVLVNGNPIISKTELSQEDSIEITCISHTEPGQIKVLVSPDKMNGILELSNEYISTFELVDSQPANNLTVKTTRKRELAFAHTKESLLKLLHTNNVIYGIDVAALDDLIKNPQDGMVVVARGLAPGASTDDYIELLFDQKSNVPLEDFSGKISFKEQSNIQSVTSGETLAQKVPGKIGTPGINVFNQPCVAREPKRIDLVTGPGAELSEDGSKAIATNDGQPKVKKAANTMVISVEPVLSINGDVNVKTGNIRFKGDVNIIGSVENDMSVSATGNITVNNLITKCTIIAGGDIVIKGNIVNSEVVSGGFIVLCNTLKPLLGDLLKILEDIYISASLMMEKLPAKSNVIFGNVLVLLIEKKFIHFPSLLERTNKKLKQLDLKLLGNFENTLEKIIASLTGINILNYKTPADYQQVLHELNKFFYFIDSLISKRSLVNVKVALNSVIRSSGDVMVSGGLFNTHVVAEGNVKVDGIVRGGIIEALDDVTIKQIGSEMGTKSIVKVASGKKIKLDHALDGVTVQVGKMSRILDKPLKNIEVSLDEEGYLQFKNK